MIMRLESGSDCGGDREHNRQTPQGAVDRLQETGKRELQLILGVGSDTMSVQGITSQNKLIHMLFFQVGLYYIRGGETVHFIPG